MRLIGLTGSEYLSTRNNFMNIKFQTARLIKLILFPYKNHGFISTKFFDHLTQLLFFLKAVNGKRTSRMISTSSKVEFAIESLSFSLYAIRH